MKYQNSIEIVPAILPKSFDDLAERLERLRVLSIPAGAVPLVQIDLVGTSVLEGRGAVPLNDVFAFEYDLMLPEPARVAAQCAALGARRIVIHAEDTDAAAALAQMQNARGERLELGVALRAHDTPEALAPFKGLYDYVQVMGIDRIGVQGEPPDPHRRELALTKALRAQYPSLTIQIDGAAAAHPRELAEAGAHRLIVGSAIINAEDPLAAYQALYTKVNAH